ncbi:MAG: energy-coupling factor transporter transmembrane component T [Methanolobus sp.]
MDNLFLSFVPGNSLLHRLDTRTKIIGIMLGSIGILKASLFSDFLFIGIVFLSLVLMSGISLIHFLRSVKPMFLFFTILFLVQLFLVEGTPIFRFMWVSASLEGLVLGATITMRFVFLLLFAAILTATTSPSAITAGIEKLLRPLPLKYLGVTSHDIAMMMSLAIYFVPLLYTNFRELKDAQFSRGLDLKKEPIKAIFSLSVPLVTSSVRRVEEVALAMESRCYTGVGRSSMQVMGFKFRDYAFCLLVMVIFVYFVVI